MSQTTNTNVGILIQATDNASRVVSDIGLSFDQLSSKVSGTEIKLIGLGAAVAFLGGTAISKIAQLNQVLEFAQKTINNPVSQNLFTAVSQAAEDAISDVRPLSELIRDTSFVATSFNKGFSGSTKKIGDDIEQRFAGVVDKVSEKITSKFSDVFAKIPIENIPFADRIAKSLNFDIVGKKLDESLALPFFSGAVKKAFGDDLGGALESSVKLFGANSPIATALPSFLQEALGGSASKGLKGLITSQLTEGFLGAFQTIDKTSQAIFGKLGFSLGENLFQGINPKFRKLFGDTDKLFGGNITGFLSDSFAGVDKIVGERLSSGLFNVLKTISVNPARSVGGVIVSSLLDSIYGSLPPGLVTAIEFALEVVTKETKDNLKAAFTEQATASLDGLLAPLTKSPVRQAEEEIKRLRAIASNERNNSLTQKADNLQSNSNEIAANQFQGVKARRDEINRLNTESQDPNVSRNKQRQAAERAAELADELEEIRKNNVKRVAEIRKIRKDAEIADNGDETRKTAADQADTLDAALKAQIADVEKQKQNYKDLAKQIAQSNLPLEEQKELTKGILKELQNLDQSLTSPLERFAASLSQGLGSGLDFAIGGDGELKKKILDSLGDFNDLFGGIPLSAASTLGGNAAKSFAGGFIKGLSTNFAPAVDAIDQTILGIIDRLENLTQELSTPLNVIENAVVPLASFSEPVEIFEKLQGAVGTVAEGVSDIAQRITFFSSGLDALKSLASTGPFQLLIGQNIEFRQQLLSVQSSLVGVSKIVDSFSGKELIDPTTAINALNGPVRNAIQALRVESIDLVGVTSKDLVPLFQQIAGQITQVGGGLNDAKDLAKAFGASLGTLGVPLSMSQQEISSILNGTIDTNSVLAKTLNITNQQVENWKSQGTLISQLSKRLEPFVAGNKIAATSFEGVTSNIQEVFDELGRQSGETLLDPLVTQFTRFYDYLRANESQLLAYVSSLVANIQIAGLAVASIIETLFTSLGSLASQVPVILFESLATGLTTVASAIKTVVAILQPAINLLTSLAQQMTGLGGFFFQTFVQVKILQTGLSALGGGFDLVTRSIPGLDSLLFLVGGRTSSLFNQFSSLSSLFNSTGGAGFLLLGKYLNNIPGLAGAVAGKLGPLGGILTAFIPSIAGVGVQLAGLSKIVPGLGGALLGVAGLGPKLLTVFSSLAEKNALFGDALKPLAPLLSSTAKSLGEYTNASDLGAKLNQKFAEAAAEAGKAVKQQIISFGLLAAGAFAAFLIIDNFILKNKELLDILGAITQGLSVFAQGIFAFFTNPVTLAVTAVTLLAIAVRANLLPAILDLIKTQIAAWAVGFAASLGGLATTLANVSSGAGAFSKALALTELATGASQASQGLSGMAEVLSSGGLKAELAQFILAVKSGSIGLKVKAFFANLASVSLARMAGVARLMGLETLALKLGATSVGLGFTSGAANAAAVSFGTLASSIYATLSGLLLLAAPFIAIAAGIALIGFVSYTKALEDSNEATDILSQQTERLGDEAAQTANKIKAAKDRQAKSDKDGIRLTDEQYKQNKEILAQGKQKIGDIEDQIKVLKVFKDEAFGDENKKAIDNQIAGLQKSKESIEKASENIKIAPKDLVRQGSELEQLAQKAKAAELAITKSNGDPEIFKQKAEELFKLTEEQLKKGQISETEARRRLGTLTSNALATNETIAKAQETLTAVYASEAAKRTETVTAQIAFAETKAASGVLSEMEGQVNLTKLKKQQLDIQLQNIEQAAAAEKEARKKGLEESLTNLDKEIAEAAKRVNEATPKDKDAAVKNLFEKNTKRGQLEIDYQNVIKEIERKSGLERYKNQTERDKIEIDNQKRTQEIKLKRLEEYQKKALDLASAAEISRNIDITKLENAGELSQAEANERRTNSNRTRIKLELAAENERRAKLEALPKPKNESDAAAREEQIRSSRIKTQQLIQQSLDGERKAYEAHIATIVDGIEGKQTDAQIDLNKLINSGAKSERDLALLTASQKVNLLKKNIEIETKNVDNRKELELELQVALRELYNQGIENQLAQIERADKVRAISLQKLINSGAAIEASASAQDATAQREKLEKQLELETKNKSKRLDLELEYQKAIKAEQEARVQESLALLDLEQTAERTAIQEKLNLGKIAEEDAAVVRSQQKIRQIQQELALETNNKEKRLKLEESLAEAQGQLQDTVVARNQAKQQLANQIYQNQIDKQNQALQKQQTLYDLLTQALEQRNRLNQVSAELARATADYLTGELDLISQGEKSEYRKRQLAEITAAIKLEALRKQQEFERESLKIAQEQNRLALEREKIQNRIKQGESLAQIAQTQADIALLKSDPKKANSEAGQAQLQALQLKLNAQGFGFEQLQAESKFLDRKELINKQSEAAEIRKLQLSQTLSQDKARFDLAQTLPPGLRERATRGLQDELATRLGATDKNDLINSGLVRSRSIAAQEFRGINQSVGLSAYDPELEFLSGALSPGQFGAALKQVQGDVLKTFGEINSGVFSTLDTSGKKLQLLPGFSGLDIPKEKQGGNVLNLTPTNTITIQVQGGSKEAAATTGDAVLKQLDNVLRQAETIAKSRFAA
jgi:hypothetical protein